MLASNYDFAVNVVMAINIAINKTFCVHDLVNKTFIAMFFDQKNSNVLIVISSYR